MSDRPRDEHLRALDAVLPFPDDRRAEIVEEIASHYDDAIADGLTDAATQRRLGDPVDLARDLARPEQTAWRVLAGVGAAVRGGIGHGLYGYLLGSLFVIVAALSGAALVQLVGAWLGTGWSLQGSDGGWNTMLTAGAAALGLYYAGRVIPDRLARNSRRLERDVRPWATGTATVVAATVSLLVVDAPQNWASVVSLALAPAALALGAYRPDLLPSGLRAYAAIAVLVLVVPVSLLALAGGSASGVPVESTSGPPDRNLAHIGPWWPPAGETSGATAIDRDWSPSEGRAVEWRATFAAGALHGLEDLRLEAWHTDPETFSIDMGHEAPFATAVPSRAGHTLVATIDTTAEPGVAFWDLVLTGVGPDGVRYVVDAGAGGQSTFTGSAWDWVVATVDD